MLTATVTKKSVNSIQPKLYNIVLNLILLEDGTEKLNQDFNVEFHPGDNIADKTTKVIEDMQRAIDNYKMEKTILNSSALDNAVNSIEGGLTL